MRLLGRDNRPVVAAAEAVWVVLAGRTAGRRSLGFVPMLGS